MPCNDCNHHSEYLRLPWLHWSNSTHSFNAKAWLQIQFHDSGKLKSHKSLLQHFSSVVAFCRTAVFFANSIFCNSSYGFFRVCAPIKKHLQIIWTIATPPTIHPRRNSYTSPRSKATTTKSRPSADTYMSTHMSSDRQH